MQKKTVLTTPIRAEDVRKLKVGDIVYITGTLVTARDAAHRRIIQYLKEKRDLPFSFSGLPLFHCGPLVKQVNKEWAVIAAGPTTSMRMEPFESKVIQKLDVHLIIGKGGMGAETSTAMQRFSVAYAAFTGGAAVLAAKTVKRVKAVHWLDLGTPEAVWILEVDQFGPLTMCMDTHGNNLFRDVRVRSEENRSKIAGFVERQ